MKVVDMLAERYQRIVCRLSGRKIAGVILHIGVVATVVIAIKFAVVYAVDSMRPASHWITYQFVEPVQKRYRVGQVPSFRTRAIRFHSVDITWNDTMYCRNWTGPGRGKLKHIGSAPNLPIFHAPAAYIGYDTLPVSLDQNFKVLDGYWNWEGPLPLVPSICFIEPRPVIYPSTSVKPKLVPVPNSGYFEFYDPKKGP